MTNSFDLDDLLEFRIQFRHENSDFLDNRHFTANNHKSAIEMFEFACSKDDIDVEIVQIEQWNRWADRWENVEILVDQ